MATHADTPDGQLATAVEEHTSVTPPDTPPPNDTDETRTIASELAADTDLDAPMDLDDGTVGEDATEIRPSMTYLRMGLAAGLLAVLALSGLVGWLMLRSNQSHRAHEELALFLQTGRQSALNLTTIDYTHADADIQRVLDGATGAFYDDFHQRSQPFADVVKQTQSKSQGSITEAGLESVQDDGAQVLVAVKVTTTSIGAAEQQPRFWRMRIEVQKVGDGAKVSNVQFVP